MKNKPIYLAIMILIITGCSMKEPLPSKIYFEQATLLSNMGICKQHGYITSNDYSSGLISMIYIMNTLDFDKQKFLNEYSKTSDSRKKAKGTPALCNGVRIDIDQLLTLALNHKQTSERRSINKQRTFESIAQTFQMLGQKSQQAGQQSLNSVQNTQVVSPAINYPNNTININALPTPEGYQKTVVPSGSVGVLRNNTISNGVKLCEYSNSRAIRVMVSQTCPSILNP